MVCKADHEFFSVMEIAAESTAPDVREKAFDMIRNYLEQEAEDVNRLRMDRGAEIAPIHKAAQLGNKELLDICLNHPNIDVNKQYKVNGEDQGNILVLAVSLEARKTEDTVLEILESILSVKEIEVNRYTDPSMATMPVALEAAVRHENMEVVSLLLSKESTFPCFNHYFALMSCLLNDNIKLFRELVAAVPEVSRLLWTPPSLATGCPRPRCPSPDPSLLHCAICSLRPGFLRALLQAGHEASAARPVTRLTPIQDAVRTLKGAVRHPDNTPTTKMIHCVCPSLVGELLDAPGIDLGVEVKAPDGVQRLGLDLALEEAQCPAVRKVLQRARQRLGLRRKLESRKEAAAAGSSARACWSCRARVAELSLCSGCKEAWYCGAPCQRRHWGEHWRWCDARAKEMGEQVEEVAAAAEARPYPTDSLAFQLD
jgi:hypothetical protein